MTAFRLSHCASLVQAIATQRSSSTAAERSPGAAITTVRRLDRVCGAIAGGFCGASVGGTVEKLGPGEVHTDLELRQVDALPAPALFTRRETRQEAHDCVQTGHVIVVGIAEAHVLAIRRTGQIGEAGERVDRGRIRHEVGPGSPLSHPRHLDVDHTRVGLLNLLRSQFPSGPSTPTEKLSITTSALSQS